jgi:asparagine synthase (glutamine-hydrolysing)
VWLKEAGVKVHAFTLDFGVHSVEKEQAGIVAKALDIPLTFVRVDGEQIADIIPELVWKLDLPFGDPVTGPLYLLAKAARAQGLSCVFNGEGGDQLFGGWTSKPMVAAEIYSGIVRDESRDTRVERYLESYHRFYGLEEQLYSPAFKEAVGTPGVRRAVLAPYLQTSDARTFLNRIRLTDISLKGSQNILPRMDRTAQCWGLDVRTPMFDRALAEASFRLPPQMKLHGATEKYVLKLTLQNKLPTEIVWRRKYGMGVPIRQWTLGPLRAQMEDLIGPAALARRGLFQSGYVTELLQGRDTPDQIRSRRIGERLWALAMLEAWMRTFIDGRGRKPGGVS